MVETILVATDGSEAAAAVEQCGVSLAARLRVRLSGVTVTEDRDVQPPSSSGLGVPAFPQNEVSSYYRARAEAVAKRFAEKARGDGREATCDTLQGTADDTISGGTEHDVILGDHGLLDMILPPNQNFK